MRLVRYLAGGGEAWGIVEGERVAELKGTPYQGIEPTGRGHDLATLHLLAPCNPSKVVGVGLNYAGHVAERGRKLPDLPVVFFKALSALVGPEDAIVLPFPEHAVEHEAELTVVMRHRASHVTRDEALRYVLGYTCGNDVSDRDIQRKESAATGKSFDTFAPVGPFVATDLDPANLKIECTVNGEVRQSSSTADMIFDVPSIVSFVSQRMTLLPGDIVMTGSPPGTRSLRPGDVVEVRIEGIGTLRNRVMAK